MTVGTRHWFLPVSLHRESAQSPIGEADAPTCATTPVAVKITLRRLESTDQHLRATALARAVEPVARQGAPTATRLQWSRDNLDATKAKWHSGMGDPHRPPEQRCIAQTVLPAAFERRRRLRHVGRPPPPRMRGVCTGDWRATMQAPDPTQLRRQTA